MPETASPATHDTADPNSLRAARLVAGISIRLLEARTGINRGRLSIIERGVPPSPEEREAILRAIAAGPPA